MRKIAADGARFQHQPRKFADAAENGRSASASLSGQEFLGVRGAGHVAEFARVAIHDGGLACSRDNDGPLRGSMRAGASAGKDQRAAPGSATSTICGVRTEWAIARQKLERRFRVEENDATKVPCAVRQWKRAEIHARDDGERSQRSDQQFVQVVARHVFHDASAAFRLHAFSGHKFHAQAEIADSAVGMAQRRTRICGDDAANRRAIRKREPRAAGIVFSPPACATDPRFARPARRRE